MKMETIQRDLLNITVRQIKGDEEEDVIILSQVSQVRMKEIKE